ncbi:MAG: tetratricopeptide repeat protein [Ardenticatenaceae bacterium]|nr:tetratricopeptide repeat protein [Ardenticatenaceae bacterium]
MITDSVTYLTTLHNLLNQHFSLAEIHNLCFYLNVDYESVPGETKPSRTRELLLTLGRNDRLDDLISLLQQQRPQIAWPPVPSNFQLPASMVSDETTISVSTQDIHGDMVQGDQVHGDKIQTQTYNNKQIASSGHGAINVSGDVSADGNIHIGNKYIIPLLVILLIIVIAIAVIFLVSREGLQIVEESSRTQLPVFPETDFVVAVSEFQIDGNSRIDNPEAIADTFASEVQVIIDQNKENGSNVTFVSPTTLNTKVVGDTPEDRAQHAEVIAEEINADIIIYGVITWNDWQANVGIEFVVSDEYVELSEGEEIVERPDFSVEGPYFPAFEVKIEKGDNQEALDSARARFSHGFQALTLIASGLSHYTLGSYQLAEQDFMQAHEMVKSIPDWESDDVISVLLGNAIGQQCADLFFQESMHQSAVACFNDAITYYESAISENSQYPRAYLGRGSAFYMQGIGDPFQDDYRDTDINLLNKAIDDYSEALNDKENLPEANIEAKANLGLGQAYLMLAVFEADQKGMRLTIENEMLLEAKARFESVTTKCKLDDCAGGVDFWLQELSAKAYANLGLIYYLVQDLEQAANLYGQAIDLLPPFTTGQRRLKKTYEEIREQIINEMDGQTAFINVKRGS